MIFDVTIGLHCLAFKTLNPHYHIIASNEILHCVCCVHREKLLFSANLRRHCIPSRHTLLTQVCEIYSCLKFVPFVF